MKPRIYIASPLGFSEAGQYWYYNVLVPLVERCGFEVVDPWKLTAPAIIKTAMFSPEGPEQRRAWEAANKIIGENNERGIQTSHLVLGLLDGPDVDSGTASEIGFAAGINKPIEGYRNDFRLAGDNIGSRINLQVEHWIRRMGGVISPDLKALETVLQERKFI